MSERSTLSAIRDDFPILKHRTYLDTACYAPGYRRAAEAVADWWASALYIPGSTFDQTLAWLRPVAYARAEAATLLNASEDEIGFITSTAMGMNKIANAVDLREGDNIVINELEFAANTVPFLRHRQRGVEIRRVPHRAGRLHIDDFARLIDARTRIVAVSSVQWSTGFHVDLAALVALAEERGAYVVVDTCQSLGAIEFDVKALGVHFMATQAHKWLFGPFGTGLIYCRRDLIDRLDPMEVETGNLAKDPARQPYHYQYDLDNIADYDHGLAPTAARLQSCSNLPGLWGLLAALRCINTVGIKVIEARVLALGDYLLERLRRVKDVTVVSSIVPSERSGLTVITAGSVDADVRLMRQLGEAGIGVSVRYQAGCGGIRISCHFYNNEEDIDRLIAALLGETRTLYFH